VSDLELYWTHAPECRVEALAITSDTGDDELVRSSA